MFRVREQVNVQEAKSRPGSSCSKTKFAEALCRQILHLHSQMAIHHPARAAAVVGSKRWRCHVTI